MPATNGLVEDLEMMAVLDPVDYLTIDQIMDRIRTFRGIGEGIVWPSKSEVTFVLVRLDHNCLADSVRTDERGYRLSSVGARRLAAWQALSDATEKLA